MPAPGCGNPAGPCACGAWHTAETPPPAPPRSRIFRDPELDVLVDRARAAFDALSPEEKAAHRREQKISFVYGNLSLMRNGTSLTREDIARMVDRSEAVKRADAAELLSRFVRPWRDMVRVQLRGEP